MRAERQRSSVGVDRQCSTMGVDRQRSTARRTRFAGLLVLVALVMAARAEASEPTPVSVDVLFLYTPGVTTRYGSAVDTRLQHLINVSNQIFAASEAGVRLRHVYSQEVAYGDASSSGEALDAVTQNQGVFSNVEALRASHGADLVVLLRPYANDGTCGMAWIGGYRANGDFSYSRRYGYSHVCPDCSDTTLAHELGHNMGLMH